MPPAVGIFCSMTLTTYAVFAMLGLTSVEDTFQARLDLLDGVDQRLILPIEQMGCDIIDVDLGLVALFEGIERGIIPGGDVPGVVVEGDHLTAAAQAVAMLRSGQATKYPALRAVGDGPQALAELYPPMQKVVFTGGRGTLGNAGHCNALWAFLMPFSRFFGHYVGNTTRWTRNCPRPGLTRRPTVPASSASSPGC